MELSIVICTYNSRDTVLDCIESIYNNIKNICFEVIVVDNASTDQTPKEIKENFPEVFIIENSSNLGFGRANNIGFEKANGTFILVLNPDTRVRTNSIEKMVYFLKKNKNIGLLTCKLLNLDGTIQYSARRFISIIETLCFRTPFKKIFPDSKVQQLNNFYLMKDWDHNQNKQVDWAIGACLLIPKTILKEIGGFDERFFMYYEDVDLCIRIQKSGFRVFYFADSIIDHEHKQGSTKSFNRLSIIHFKSMVKFYTKHYFLLFKNKKVI